MQNRNPRLDPESTRYAHRDCSWKPAGKERLAGRAGGPGQQTRRCPEGFQGQPLRGGPILGPGFRCSAGLDAMRGQNNCVARYRDRSGGRLPAAFGVAEPLFADDTLPENDRCRHELGLTGARARMGAASDQPGLAALRAARGLTSLLAHQPLRQYHAGQSSHFRAVPPSTQPRSSPDRPGSAFKP